MASAPPAAVPAGTRARLDRSLRLARILDTAFRLPGTRIRFGVDQLLGLVPGLGDAIAALIGAYIIWSAARAGAPALIVGRMLANVGVDAVVGAVPLLGTVFDVAFKAHRRNARMLAEWSAEPQAAVARQRRLLLMLVAIVIAMFLIATAALAFGAWALWRLLG